MFARVIMAGLSLAARFRRGVTENRETTKYTGWTVVVMGGWFALSVWLQLLGGGHVLLKLAQNWVQRSVPLEIARRGDVRPDRFFVAVRQWPPAVCDHG